MAAESIGELPLRIVGVEKSIVSYTWSDYYFWKQKKIEQKKLLFTHTTALSITTNIMVVQLIFVDGSSSSSVKGSNNLMGEPSRMICSNSRTGVVLGISGDTL